MFIHSSNLVWSVISFIVFSGAQLINTNAALLHICIKTTVSRKHSETTNLMRTVVIVVCVVLAEFILCDRLSKGILPRIFKFLYDHESFCGDVFEEPEWLPSYRNCNIECDIASEICLAMVDSSPKVQKCRKLPNDCALRLAKHLGIQPLPSVQLLSNTDEQRRFRSQQQQDQSRIEKSDKNIDKFTASIVVSNETESSNLTQQINRSHRVHQSSDIRRGEKPNNETQIKWPLPARVSVVDGDIEHEGIREAISNGRRAWTNRNMEHLLDNHFISYIAQRPLVMYTDVNNFDTPNVPLSSSEVTEFHANDITRGQQQRQKFDDRLISDVSRGKSDAYRLAEDNVFDKLDRSTQWMHQRIAHISSTKDGKPSSVVYPIAYGSIIQPGLQPAISSSLPIDRFIFTPRTVDSVRLSPKKHDGLEIESNLQRSRFLRGFAHTNGEKSLSSYETQLHQGAISNVRRVSVRTPKSVVKKSNECVSDQMPCRTAMHFILPFAHKAPTDVDRMRNPAELTGNSHHIDDPLGISRSRLRYDHVYAIENEMARWKLSPGISGPQRIS
ncbi:hypothetical protein AB6A40_004107 [Gnathostoma spinigerum]|uniref:FZ domain-containing protein n=1 Tax=Gnathostoma spinigerum TaxID=75299 RepID=A0ABD6EKA7_9BILA